MAKVALGWPLLLAALFVIGLLLSRGRTPIEDARPVQATSSPDPAPGSVTLVTRSGLNSLLMCLARHDLRILGAP